MTPDSNLEKNSERNDVQLEFDWKLSDLVENNESKQVDLPESWEEFWEDLEDDAHR